MWFARDKYFSWKLSEKIFLFLLNYTLDCIVIIGVVFYSDEINIVESHLSRHLRSHVNFFGIGYTISDSFNCDKN